MMRRILAAAMFFAALAAAAAGAAPADWRTRLAPYATGMGQPGYDGAKYLIPAAAQEAEEMRRRLDLYAEASAALAGYRAANLGTLETDELRRTAEELAAALRQFGESCVQSAALDLAEADARLAQLEEFVRIQDARMAAAEPVFHPDRGTLESVRERLDRAAGLVRSDDLRLAELRARLEVLKEADARLRAALAGDTRLGPDVYAGDDAAEMKQFAEQVVVRAQPGICLLKTALVSPEWTEESGAEWADPAQTALRRRTTRSLTAQVAARLNANTKLYTVDLGRDLSASGAWGPVAGRVMFADPMLEENAK